MKRLLLLLSLFCCHTILSSGQESPVTRTTPAASGAAQSPVSRGIQATRPPREPGAEFLSTDTALQHAFSWAKTMALHYRGKPEDPVGPWYESALPPRYAFCMRDVSHQCIGAEILGLHRENKNMFTKFTSNISSSKDWCSYWEMDKLDRPSPSDYRNDREFWYNLNANFDLLDACWRSWLWTGDSLYLKDPAFRNFYNRSAREYILQWSLQPDSLLTRAAHPNAPTPFNIEDPFHRCRGLPSYSEGVPNLKMGVDLVAALYRGLSSYAAILKANGDPGGSGIYLQQAQVYRQRIDADWWDERAALYYTHYTNDHQFGKAEGETFLLWFDALKDSSRKRSTIEHIQSMNLNVENLSYLPLQYYRNGYWDKAYDLILHLANPSTQRREYPEVSYGLIEAIVQGLMGVEPDAMTRTVSTIYRPGKSMQADHTMGSGGAAGSGEAFGSGEMGGPMKSQISRLPVLNTSVTLTHFDGGQSALVNTGKHSFRWKARFYGDYEQGLISRQAGGVRGKKNEGVDRMKKEKDEQGSLISYLEVEVAPGEKIDVRVDRGGR